MPFPINPAGVLALDNGGPAECEIRADAHDDPGSQTDREAFVVAVPQTDATVPFRGNRGCDLHHPEEPLPFVDEAELFTFDIPIMGFDNFGHGFDYVDVRNRTPCLR